MTHAVFNRCNRHHMSHDPTIPLKCPYCGDRLVYLMTHGDTHVYSCENDGYMVLPPDGGVRRETAAETSDRKSGDLM